MTHLRILWITHLVLIYQLFTHARSCHTGCTCENLGIDRYDMDRYNTQCVNQNLRRIPAEIPDTTTQLHLEGNALGVINQHSFSRFVLLRRLSLRRSGITEIHSRAFHGLIDLSNIDLSYNELHTLHAYTFSGLPALDTLILDHNQLTTIESQAFTGLGDAMYMMGVTISLHHNHNLAHISQDAFVDSKVETLYISNASLTSDSLNALKYLASSLKIFFMQNNYVPLDVPVDLFRGFDLRSLDLTNNGISDVEFLGNLRTQALSIPNNPFGNTNWSRYSILNSVRHLYLDNTGLSDLDPTYFSGLSRLELLSLKHNEITTISSELKSLFTRLREMSLEDNPLHCNCELTWLHSLVHRKKRAYSLDAVCATPRRQKVFDMSVEDFICSAPTRVTIKEHFVDGDPALRCETNGDPCPDIIWTLPDGENIVVPASSNCNKPEIQSYLALSINSTNGLYKCHASNQVGSHSNEVLVNGDEIVPSAVVGDSNQGSGLFPLSTLNFLICLVGLLSLKVL